MHPASRHPAVFSSIPTSTALNDVPVEIAEYVGSMISLDDPRHLRLRSIVNRAFTPKRSPASRSVLGRADFRWTSIVLCGGDEEIGGDDDNIVTAVPALGEYGLALAEQPHRGHRDEWGANESGDKVPMGYNSANRDERKFANRWLFDVTRDP